MTRFCSYFRRMDTFSCTAEPKLSMIRVKDNRHEISKSAVQSSLMITINEEDRTCGLRITKISIINPDTETRTTRHPTNRLASTQIGTETQIQIDSILKIDQVTPGSTNQTTVSKLSITSILDQKTQILNTTKTFHRATICLRPTQFNSSMSMIQT